VEKHVSRGSATSLSQEGGAPAYPKCLLPMYAYKVWETTTTFCIVLKLHVRIYMIDHKC